jgi:hypothetical protein
MGMGFWTAGRLTAYAPGLLDFWTAEQVHLWVWVQTWFVCVENIQTQVQTQVQTWFQILWVDLWI